VRALGVIETEKTVAEWLFVAVAVVEACGASVADDVAPSEFASESK
jgi:hypothetical protein